MTAPRSKGEIQPKQPKPVLNVPAYFLYGEVWTAETFGFFHIEPLSVRNVPNDWRIGLHTHPDFDQISIVFSGDCSFEHDGQPAHVLGPCCVFTPAEVVHQFQYRRDSRGFVVSVSSDFTDSLAFDDSAIKAAMLNLARARQVSLVPRGAVAALERLAKLMADCFGSRHAHRRDMIRYLFGAFILELNAAFAASPATGAGAAASKFNAVDLFQRFSAQVEAGIGRLGLSGKPPEWPHTVEEFAARLSTTPYALNAACRKACSRSALDIIQAAMLGQATRLLLYSNRSIKEISYGFGYSHPSHFGRFFKRHRGMTPETFRQQHVYQVRSEAPRLNTSHKQES